MPMNFTKPSKSNYPSSETPRECWDMMRHAKQTIMTSNWSSGVSKDKRMQAILDLREHQEHAGVDISPLSEFNITKQEMQDWLVSDPKRTAKMLHSELVNTINQEVKNATNAIRDRYRKKLDEYRGNNKGFKR